MQYSPPSLLSESEGPLVFESRLAAKVDAAEISSCLDCLKFALEPGLGPGFLPTVPFLFVISLSTLGLELPLANEARLDIVERCTEFVVFWLDEELAIVDLRCRPPSALTFSDMLI